MAKFGLIVPFQEMIEIAKPIIKEEELDVTYMKVVSTADAVKEARNAVDAGADIIISRGHIASLIKKNTNVPLIEMRIHTQEIGLLIKRIKTMLKKECPHIAIVCYRNMLSDMSKMSELFDVKLSVAYIKASEDSLACVNNLKNQGVDFIIGGTITCNNANSLGLPSLVYGSSAESIKEAFREAQKMAFAIEAEKWNEIQLETVLDTTFNGIIKINADGCIIAINKLVENLFGITLEDVVGKQVSDILPEFNHTMVKNVLSGKTENYTISVNIKKQAWILTMASIQYDETIMGAILSLQKLSENIRTQSKFQKNMYMSGYVADTLFEHINTDNEDMRKQLELARKYALSERPVLIYADEGTEYYSFAEAIHNGSARKNAPFVNINLYALEQNEQAEILFGKQKEKMEFDSLSAMGKAQYGTLFIRGIEKASLKVQNRLARLINSGSMSKTDIQPMDICNVRLIMLSKTELNGLVEQGQFSEELYYSVQGLVLEIMPLRRRTEDLINLFERKFAEFCKKHSKYLVLTQGAYNRVTQLKWPGNRLQINSFCEALVLTTDKRSVDEVRIQALYDKLYPKQIVCEGRKQIIVYKSPEAEELNKLLERYHGNRGKVAKELGISTTTLWRKMKKYGIE